MRAQGIAAAPAIRVARGVGALWRFSRPHTIVGTTLSVVGLYAIAAELVTVRGGFDLAATMIAAWCVNIAIVGLNQIEDIEIDRINKPELPLAAGDLGIGAAKAIVAVTAIVPIGMAATQGALELSAVLVALAVGLAYSSPPLRLKRFPAFAALSISLVRSVVVNLGVFGHFVGSLASVPGVIWVLTAFVVPFSAAIALLKDVPDIPGDRVFSIRTLSVRLGPGRVLAIGVTTLAMAYVAMACAPLVVSLGVNAAVWVAGHVGALVMLVAFALRVSPADRIDVTRFYMRVWQLFFLEYLLVPVSVIA
jgi:homogentisate phytyltransferase / homogentisate geranylgeranyltransferase